MACRPPSLHLDRLSTGRGRRACHQAQLELGYSLDEKCIAEIKDNVIRLLETPTATIEAGIDAGLLVAIDTGAVFVGTVSPAR